MENLANSTPEIRQANKAQAAEFFDVSLPTIDAWIRKGAPVVQKGSQGVSWIIDLRAMAAWAYSAKTGDGEQDPDNLTPAERKAWYEGEVKRRDLMERDRELIQAGEVERVVSVAFASFAQHIWSLPDNMERRHGISPDVVELVEGGLREGMEQLAFSLSTLGSVEP